MNKTIGDMCNIHTGKLDANAAVEGGCYPFYTCAEFPDSIDEYAYDDDVVLIAGNNAKGNFHVNRYTGKFNAYQRTYILKAKGNYCIDYIYYALKLELKRLREKSQGSQTKFLTMPLLQQIQVSVIDGDKQAKISKILKFLDKKIGINNSVINELEFISKTIFEYWFVQYNFPDNDSKPYKASDGHLVFDTLLKRSIPRDWNVRQLSDIANITMGQSPNGHSYNEVGLGTVFYQGSTDFGRIFPKTRQFTTEPARMAKRGDILLSVRAPVGDMNIANTDCCIGRGLAALNSKDGFDGFLFYVMKYFKQVFDRRNSEGTTFGSITKNDLYSLKLAYPPKELLEKYDNIVSKYNEMIFIRSMENQKLEELRDWLLPMLMNGQISIRDAEEHIANTFE